MPSLFNALGSAVSEPNQNATALYSQIWINEADFIGMQPNDRVKKIDDCWTDFVNDKLPRLRTVLDTALAAEITAAKKAAKKKHLP